MGFAGAAANGSGATSPGVCAAIRAGRAGQRPKAPRPAAGRSLGVRPPGGARASPGLGLGGFVRRVVLYERAAGGKQGSWGALCELSTLQSRSENFAAAGEGARGAALRPRGRCWRRLRWAGGIARWGREVGFFCLAPLPLPSELGRPPGGRDCSLQVSDPHALLPKGAPRAPRLLPRFSAPPRPVGAGPLPLLPLKMAAPASEVGGDCIRRPPPALPFPPPPRPFLLRLDAPPRPQPGGRADGRRVARPSGADSIILQQQRHLVGRPPASPAG